MHELYELKEKLMKELEEYGTQDMSAGTLQVVDTLAHTIKNICKIIEASEGEEYSMRGGQGGGNYSRNYGGGRYAYEGGRGGGNRYAYEGGQGGGSSYARGRGRNARRDSMGRYTSEGGYSRADGMETLVEDIRSMMQELPQNVQQEAQKFVQKLEQEM